MDLLLQSLQYIVDPANWAGENGIGVRLLQHLGITLLTLVIASVIAIPIGYLIGHTGRGKNIAVLASGGIRALPTLGLLTLVALSVGVGLKAPIVAFVVLAIPSILAGAYSGFEAIDRRAIDAARSVGMSEWGIVRRVEVPLGLPLLAGGLRSATLQVIATATLADYVGGGGLGRFIFSGLKTNNYPLMLAGSILVVLLALILEGVFSLIQRGVVPAGVRAQQRAQTSSRPSRTRAAAV